MNNHRAGADYPPQIRFKRWNGNTDLPLPEYATAGAAGFDLRAAVDGDPVILEPSEWALVSTGFAVALPSGYELQIRPRSGLAAKHGITLLNSPGTVDADYRGLVSVCLINLSQTPFTIARGDRIAQGVVAPAPQFSLVEVEEIDETLRGAGGFGSTGIA
ncbi:dUTP diphosphatase [Brevundimonas diminuta]|uniref:dUTP diphosphatase n=1 Tax=Brevundimonas diminuta TaxID=293 RepID=UPI0030F9996F